MTNTTDFQSALASLTASITSGTSLTPAIDLGGCTLAGLIAPAAWDSAALTFQCSVDGTTFYDFYNAAGNELQAIVNAGKWIAVDPSDFAGIRFLKLRSGLSASAVNQTATRSFTLVARAV